MVVTRGGCDILMLSLASQLVGVLVSNLDLDRVLFIDLPRRITRRARLGKDIMFWAEADTRKEREKEEREKPFFDVYARMGFPFSSRRHEIISLIPIFRCESQLFPPTMLG
ncbi:hypothetical protein NW764_004962 [Fusarium oxysporum]|nr:hypothetical protein NW764_004962 [Fusarium oxysporum]